MGIIDTAYGNTEEEYQEFCNFLNTLSTQDPNMLWESGRMNFWRYSIHAGKEPQDRFFKDNVHVWRSDKREIVGVCISEYGKNDLFIEVLPEYNEIYPEIFRWINDAWAATREIIEIDIFGDNRNKISWLEKFGFTFQRHYENKQSYVLDEIDLGYQLEKGFRIQTFSEVNDHAGRVALVQSAFDNPNYSEKKFKGLMASPDYIDEYNLIVISPDGLPVAYCVGWHDRAKKNIGYTEPVGTHAEYRRRGFAQAVIRECFVRMKANGIQVVEIASRAEPDVANYLYDSLSPRDKRKVHRYSKKVK
ncbi:MAG: GNAT family N-acetyltransferase [Anaerolineales bacterium]|nr:GNAT family N-acetyltransferase [Anaerolineales bacterium]